MHNGGCEDNVVREDNYLPMRSFCYEACGDFFSPSVIKRGHWVIEDNRIVVGADVQLCEKACDRNNTLFSLAQNISDFRSWWKLAVVQSKLVDCLACNTSWIKPELQGYAKVAELCIQEDLEWLRQRRGDNLSAFYGNWCGVCFLEAQVLKRGHLEVT